MVPLLRCAACLALIVGGPMVVRAQTAPWSPVAPATVETPPMVGGHVDLDSFLDGHTPEPVIHEPSPGTPQYFVEPFGWQVLPAGIIYRSYLAGPKESRMAGKVINAENDGWLFDATLGSRVGILRYGTYDPIRPQGFQIDVEGSAQVRLDIPEEVDVRSTDYRAGVPLTFGYGPHQTKLAYYHLSSHVGDEFMMKNPAFDRLNFSRDALVLGQGIYLNEDVRVYAEAAWAFYSEISEEWEFQFGLDYAPGLPTGFHGAPFFAINTHLREEVNFGGTLTVQTGWAWRSDQNGGLLRLGLHYLNGESNQFSFYDQFEQQIGFGIWYDN